MKIVADAMLGRLAKWLRILGIDVSYMPDCTDSELIRVALREGRAILTRDRGFLARKSLNVPLILIRSNSVFDQLAELRDTLEFGGQGLVPRCPVCNGQLDRVARDDRLKALVPDFVYHHCDLFMKCASCGKHYWEGTHYRHVREAIGTICQR